MKNIAHQLLDDVVNEKREAQFELYQKCYEPLLNICFRYRRNREDAVALLNGAFFNILTGIPKKKKDVPFDLWAKRVTINHCLSVLRKEKKHDVVQLIDEEETLEYYAGITDDDIDQVELNEELIKQMRVHMNDLHPLTHEIFQLHVFEGYSHDEISQILNIPKGTSKWRLHQAREKLRKVLRTSLSSLLTMII